ncbi:hypothetical protein MNBD_GAMMA11-159 [hydrothermal vent metagenome]|uniref:Uncharacterized protein n=1 Tax=hydrothermal vent metagenome TaxID=652676 RepID=A0A3B0WR15_9ZZZZ
MPSLLWCEFKSESGRWKSTCLLLSTDTSLNAEQVIESYGLVQLLSCMKDRDNHKLMLSLALASGST